MYTDMVTTCFRKASIFCTLALLLGFSRGLRGKVWDPVPRLIREFGAGSTSDLAGPDSLALGFRPLEVHQPP